jgi:hypothetical protein
MPGSEKGEDIAAADVVAMRRCAERVIEHVRKTVGSVLKLSVGVT